MVNVSHRLGEANERRRVSLHNPQKNVDARPMGPLPQNALAPPQVSGRDGPHSGGVPMGRRPCGYLWGEAQSETSSKIIAREADAPGISIGAKSQALLRRACPMDERLALLVAPAGASRVVRFACFAPVIARHTLGGLGFGFGDAACIMYWLVFKQAIGGTRLSRTTFYAPCYAGNGLLGIQCGRQEEKAQQAEEYTGHEPPPKVAVPCPCYLRLAAFAKPAGRAYGG